MTRHNLGVFERPGVPQWEPFHKAYPELNTDDWEFVCLRQAEGEQPARYFYRHKERKTYLTLDAMGHAYPAGDEEAQLRMIERVDEIKKRAGENGNA